MKRGERTLTVSFEDGQRFVLPAEYLRVMTGSALDRGHGEPGRAPVAGKAGVGIRELTPIGRYAIRIAFDDGHDTGLYSWDALYDLGRGSPQMGRLPGRSGEGRPIALTLALPPLHGEGQAA
ncbi:MAG: DUF971 domain-containing protein [Caulobacteraceae bacterium]